MPIKDVRICYIAIYLIYKLLFMKKLFYIYIFFPFLLVAQSSYTVYVGPGMSFNPSELIISQGDMVTWICEGGTHDVNFDINSITNESFGNPEEISSASLSTQIGPGEMGSITFNEIGSYSYDCSVGSHAAMGMVGQIIVNEVISDCALPGLYSGNTGQNMTVFFTPDAISALSTSSNSPYIVAFSPDGVLVGSVSIASVDLQSGQAQMAVWGDDTSTADDIDGLLAGQEINFQLVDGNSLYDLNLTFDGSNSYVTNGILTVLTSSTELNCSLDEGGDVGIIEFYPPVGSTYNPDSTEITLPSASLGENYNELIEIDVPEFLTIDLNGEVLDLPINYVRNY